MKVVKGQVVEPVPDIDSRLAVYKFKIRCSFLHNQESKQVKTSYFLYCHKPAEVKACGDGCGGGLARTAMT